MANRDTEIRLYCTECDKSFYLTSKNKNNTREKLELKKFCPKCRKHTKHKEN